MRTDTLDCRVCWDLVLEEPQEENSRIWADKLIGEYKLPKSQETDFRIPGMHHTSTFSFSKHWISIHEV